MKEKFIKPNMETALVWAKMSYAQRRKVGAVLVRDDKILSQGYNGTLPGEDNACEVLLPDFDEDGNLTGEYVLKTHGEVIHAEKNAILRMATSTESTEGASLFVTLSPCLDCAIIIILAKIKEVFYLDEYRDTSGIQLLERKGIPCYKVNL